MGPFLAAFPDLHLEIDFMTSDGDRVMAYITTTGTHRNPLMGAQATGKTFKVNQVDAFRFNDDGKVAEHWGVFDTFGILAQLGLIPAPPQSDS